MPKKGYTKNEKGERVPPMEQRDKQEEAAAEAQPEERKGFIYVREAGKYKCVKACIYKGRLCSPKDEPVSVKAGEYVPHHFAPVVGVGVKKNAFGRNVTDYVTESDKQASPWDQPDHWRRLNAQNFKVFVISNKDTFPGMSRGYQAQARTKWERLFPNEAFPIEG